MRTNVVNTISSYIIWDWYGLAKVLKEVRESFLEFGGWRPILWA
jgi:hypothetical protein